MSDISGDRLLSFIERLERLGEEKADIAEQEKEVRLEAKAEGFEPKFINALVRMRKKSSEERSEEETILELYKRAIGLE